MSGRFTCFTLIAFSLVCEAQSQELTNRLQGNFSVLESGGNKKAGAAVSAAELIGTHYLFTRPSIDTLESDREIKIDQLWKERQKDLPQTHAELATLSSDSAIDLLRRRPIILMDEYESAFRATIGHSRMLRDQAMRLRKRLEIEAGNAPPSAELKRLRAWIADLDYVLLSTPDFKFYSNRLEDTYWKGLPEFPKLSLSARLNPLLRELQDISTAVASSTEKLAPSARELLVLSQKPVSLGLLLEFENQGSVFAHAAAYRRQIEDFTGLLSPSSASHQVGKSIAKRELDAAKKAFFADPPVPPISPFKRGISRFARSTLGQGLGALATVDVFYRAVFVFAADEDQPVPLFPMVYHPIDMAGELLEGDIVETAESNRTEPKTNSPTDTKSAQAHTQAKAL